MRKLLVSVALATTAVVAVPASAQYHGGHDRGWSQRGPDHRAVGHLLRSLDEVDQRIRRSAWRGAISPREAFALRRDAVQVRQRVHWAGRNGLSGREFAELRFRVNRLERRLRHERRDFDGRRG